MAGPRATRRRASPRPMERRSGCCRARSEMLRDLRSGAGCSSEERASRRALAARSATGVAPPPRYVSRNYERQQPPLFYYAAAPVAWLLRNTSLPEIVVGVRLFCVLVASLMIPLTARLARLLLPRRGVFFALPFAALLPNTLFFADRITNDALAWPILAAACVALVLAARRPSAPGRFVVLGALVAAGVWTKMSLLPLLPAALCAVLLARRRQDGRRGGAVLAAVGLPALLIAPLLVWNAAACGSWTGVTYASAARPPGLRAVLAAAGTTSFAGYLPSWFRNHLWAGGWEFLQPPAAVYWGGCGRSAPRAASSRSLPRSGDGSRLFAGARWLPLLCLAAAFVAAMLFHILSARAAGRVAGGEGWYFDLLRPLEACAAAALLCAAIAPRRARIAVAASAGLLVRRGRRRHRSACSFLTGPGSRCPTRTRDGSSTWFPPRGNRRPFSTPRCWPGFSWRRSCGAAPGWSHRHPGRPDRERSAERDPGLQLRHLAGELRLELREASP